MSARLEALKQQVIRERDQAVLDLTVAQDLVLEKQKLAADLSRDIEALEGLGYVR